MGKNLLLEREHRENAVACQRQTASSIPAEDPGENQAGKCFGIS